MIWNKQLSPDSIQVQLWLYWYRYVLNNPLRFVDPSGYMPQWVQDGYDHYNENGGGGGGFNYFGWMGNSYGSTGISSGADPYGGWTYNWGLGKYQNRASGQTMRGGDFLNNTPYLTSPKYVDYSPEAVSNTLMGSKETEFLPGTDPLGSKMAIFTYSDGKVSGGPVPFYQITGSYYNDLYYFSGLVAYDTYTALASMSGSTGGNGLSLNSPEAFTHISESSTTITYGFTPYIVHHTTAAGHIKGSGPTRIKNGVILNDVVSRKGPFFAKAKDNGWMIGAGNFSFGLTDGMFTTSFRSTSNGYAGWDSQYISVTNQYQLNWQQLGYIAAVAAFPALLEATGIYLIPAF